MQLDDLKQAWAAHGSMLERNLAINERILREVMLRKVRVALWPYALLRALEVALGVALLFLVIPVLVAHITELAYIVAVGSLAVFTLGLTIMCAYLLVNSLQIDYGGSVTTLQRAIEHMKLVEYCALKWAVLGGVVIWLPVPLVLLEVLGGEPWIARVHFPWLVANVLFGVVVVVVGMLVLRRYVERADLEPRKRRFLEALSGHALRSASDHLRELGRFEREEASQA